MVFLLEKLYWVIYKKIMIKYINCYLFIKDKLVKKDFAIINNKITFNNLDNIEKIINLKNLVVLPGFVDIHIHSRNPGYEYKETLENLNKSLIYGGFTHAIAQSNIKPLPIDKKTFNNAQSLLRILESNVIQAGRITNNNKMIENEEYLKNINFITDDGMSVVDKNEMLKALKLAKKYNIQILLHEQNPEIKGVMYDCSLSKEMNFKSFKENYESDWVERDIKLNISINAKIHLQHISTIKSLKLFKKYKKKMNITAEVTPHHLFLDNEMIKNNGIYKMNPPLSTPKTRKKLIDAFKKGIIDIVSTDHAPHDFKEKEGGFKNSVNGIIGLETSFAIINTLVVENNIELKRLIYAMSINPGRIMNINNEIFEGNLANLTIVNLDKKWIIKKEDIKAKFANSPFINKKVIGKIMKVIINGKFISLK